MFSLNDRNNKPHSHRTPTRLGPFFQPSKDRLELNTNVEQMLPETVVQIYPLRMNHVLSITLSSLFLLIFLVNGTTCFVNKPNELKWNLNIMLSGTTPYSIFFLYLLPRIEQFKTFRLNSIGPSLPSCFCTYLDFQMVKNCLLSRIWVIGRS